MVKISTFKFSCLLNPFFLCHNDNLGTWMENSFSLSLLNAAFDCISKIYFISTNSRSSKNML